MRLKVTKDQRPAREREAECPTRAGQLKARPRGMRQAGRSSSENAALGRVEGKRRQKATLQRTRTPPP
ncbi:hypothetical protein FH972_024376 [Carpinus fangiana]|uniref:Uncharacterized protein n=1 Tax=Carpinus fangiana TaxID=176857 RepID=A0A5N6KXV8_9ROSI|nr:hypothetical protein FH972_024376 [Carpinus fangiana]